jgi:hypothetical protein
MHERHTNGADDDPTQACKPSGKKGNIVKLAADPGRQ